MWKMDFIEENFSSTLPGSSSPSQNKIAKRQISRRKKQSPITFAWSPDNKIENQRRDQDRQVLYFLDKKKQKKTHKSVRN